METGEKGENARNKIIARRRKGKRIEREERERESLIRLMGLSPGCMLK